MKENRGMAMTDGKHRDLNVWISEHVFGKPILCYSNSVVRYTTDPIAAMEVLKACGKKVKIQIVFSGICWSVVWERQFPRKRDIIESSETLELAICLFAKKLFAK